MSASDALRRYRKRTPLPLTAQAGILVVAAAAAVISFDGLRTLGERAGIPHDIAWLLPISVDAAAAVATVVWLNYAVEEVAAEAKRLAYVAIAVSVGGNAAQHGLSVLGVVLPLWGQVLIAALVGAIAPGMFGAIIHLGVSAVRHREPKREIADERDVAPPPSESRPRVETPVAVPPEPPYLHDEADRVLPPPVTGPPAFFGPPAPPATEEQPRTEPMNAPPVRELHAVPPPDTRSRRQLEADARDKELIDDDGKPLRRKNREDVETFRRRVLKAEERQRRGENGAVS